MSSVICTLFEGHYHFGVAALTNSLYIQGFRGSIYAGYRGPLPSWALAVNNSSFPWLGAGTLHVAEGLQLHFLPVSTDYHLTNYKPDFLLEVLRIVPVKPTSIFYFDPDIVISAPWHYIKEWIDCGIAVCEDVNSPLSEHHPRRMAWRTFFGSKGFNLKFKDPIYANGGFVGSSISNISFFEVWKQLQEEMASEIGGLDRSALEGLPLPKRAQGPFSPFSKTDQDALNAAVEAWEGVVSFAGKEAMAFRTREPIMPHALGRHKPWQCNYLKQCLTGFAPRLVDKKYWDSVNKPISSHSSCSIRQKKISISIASFIARFYRRNGI